jgi:predicted RNA-binding Zn-ribbon protein involved in translation (DUF1610 family)
MDKKCPKCGGEFEEGYEIDSEPIAWAPKEGNILEKALTKRKNKISYRCKNCGYLESYAK